ncbi:hypothetical protein [Zavarzinella formosa]|uniref:hypothetical protein n=1 Tax=Zavarzinella formosa TaxID=360055 RepID=UPI00031C8DEA|nr:hypothetical protein [Zavarzinella formosa]
MSNGFDWRRLAPKKRFATLAIGGLFVMFAGLVLPKLFVNQPEFSGGSPPLAGLQPPVIDEGPSLPAMLARLVFGLLIVSGLIVATVRFLKQRQLRPAAAEAKNPIEVLGFLPVGRGLVYHVKIGHHHLLAGTDAFGFKSLLQLPAISATTPPDEEKDELPIIISERVRAALPV